MSLCSNVSLSQFTVPQVVLMGAAIYWAATEANYNYEVCMHVHVVKAGSL